MEGALKGEYEHCVSLLFNMIKQKHVQQSFETESKILKIVEKYVENVEPRLRATMIMNHMADLPLPDE